MSVNVSIEEHDELSQLDDQTRAAAMSRLSESGETFSAQSGADRKKMMAAAIEAAQDEVGAQIDNADRASMELLAPDGSFTIAGHVMRPLSLGTLAILERIKHPILSGSELSFDDLCTMLYVLAGQDLLAIVQASFAGADAIRTEATVWAMLIDMPEMREMEKALQPLLDSAMGWGDTEGGAEADDPTKPVRNG